MWNSPKSQPLLDTPRRAFRPASQNFGSPLRGFIGVTGRARVRDLVLVGHRRRDEAERVGVHFDVSDGRLDLRHVAGDALGAGASLLMVRVFFQRGGARAIERHGAVAVQADFVGGLSQLRIVLGPMDVVTTEAGDAATVHHALHKIIPLHAVLVRGAVGEMSKASLAEGMVFEFPEIVQVSTHTVAHRPVVVFPFDRIR